MRVDVAAGVEKEQVLCQTSRGWQLSPAEMKMDMCIDQSFK